MPLIFARCRASSRCIFARCRASSRAIALGRALEFPPRADFMVARLLIWQVLAWSPDGRRWEYIEPNMSFIPLSPGSGA